MKEKKSEVACIYVEEKPSQTHSPHLCGGGGDTPGECYLVSTSFYSCWNAGIASISPHCFEIFPFLLWDNLRLWNIKMFSFVNMIFWWTERSKDLEYNFRNIIQHFTVTLDWFNASMLYKSINFIHKSYSALSFSLHFQVLLGFDSSSPEAVEQWRDSMANPEKVVTSWHRLSRL